MRFMSALLRKVGLAPTMEISDDMEAETQRLLREHRAAVDDVVKATEANRKANNGRLHQSIENAKERTRAFTDFESLLRRDETKRRLNNGHH